MRRIAIVICVGLIPGCADFPEVDAAIGARSPQSGFPELLPLDPLLARAGAVTITPDVSADLDDRIAALRRRANALRRPVLSRGERARLQSAAARHTR